MNISFGKFMAIRMGGAVTCAFFTWLLAPKACAADLALPPIIKYGVSPPKYQPELCLQDGKNGFPWADTESRQGLQVRAAVGLSGINIIDRGSNKLGEINGTRNS